jgi:hypothetical protein
MKVEEAQDVVRSFLEATAKICPEIAPFSVQFHTHDKPFHACFRKDIPGPGAVGKSGVYFIADAESEILYIGKATTDNLGAEICGKFSRPKIVDVQDDVPRFENSSLAKWSNDPALRELLISGNVVISALAIEPGALSSLVEVFLQTRCMLGPKRCLPQLNKRIG